MKIIKYLFLGIKFVILGIAKIIWYFIYGCFTVITIFPRYFAMGLLTLLGKKKKPSKLMQNKKLALIMMVLSVEVYLICIFFISRWWVQGLKIKYLSNSIIEYTEMVEQQEQGEETTEGEPSEEANIEELTDNNTQNTDNTYYPNDYWDYMNVPFLNVNFDDLLAKNPDTVGWIKVDGTKVNYPVVQANDNDYYLSHAFNKSSNKAGWIFADYRVDFKDFGKNTIIYGHNMNNKTMFGSIPQMLYSSYLNNSANSYIKISTPTSNTVWKVFSIYMADPETFYLKTNFRTYSFEEFIDKLKSRSTYNFGVDVTADDKILTLSTCDNTGTKRVAVHAKMINIEYK